MRIAHYLDEGWQDIALLADGMVCAGLNAGDDAQRRRALDGAARMQANLARSKPLAQAMNIRRRREEKTGCKALVMMHPTENGRWLLAISFTGTTHRVADWQDNLRIEQEEGFHQGFLHLTQQFEAQCAQIPLPAFAKHLGKENVTLSDALAMLSQQDAPLSLLVTGHSQGAAVMQVLLARLVQRGALKGNLLGCGFASPCVAAERTLQNADYPIYHLINADDVVPRIGGAMHLGICRVLVDVPALRRLCYGARGQQEAFAALLALQRSARSTQDAMCFAMALLQIITTLPDHQAEALLRQLAPAYIPSMLQSRLTGYARRLANSALIRLQSRYARCFGPVDIKAVQLYVQALDGLFEHYGIMETLACLPDVLRRPHRLYRADTLCTYDIISGVSPKRLLTALWCDGDHPVWMAAPTARTGRQAKRYDRFHPLSSARNNAQRRNTK